MTWRTAPVAELEQGGDGTPDRVTLATGGDGTPQVTVPSYLSLAVGDDVVWDTVDGKPFVVLALNRLAEGALVPDLTKIMSYLKPRNSDNPRTTMAGILAPFADAIEQDVVMKFASESDRASKITVTGANGTVVAKEGMLAWMRNARRLDILNDITDGVAHWIEYAPLTYAFNAVNNVPGTVPPGGNVGVGTPGVDNGSGYGRGVNGPTVPVDGVYAGTLTVVSNLAMYSPYYQNITDSGGDTASFGRNDPCRAYATVQVPNRPDGWRASCGYGEDTWTCPFGPVEMLAGQEISGSVFQDSTRGSMNFSARWTVARVSR